MDLALNGRVAVVTGASKGIGLAVVRTLLDEGARVVAASRTPMPEDLDGRLVHVPVDLMDPAAPAEVIARAVEAYGGLDILVNNAGGPPPGVRVNSVSPGPTLTPWWTDAGGAGDIVAGWTGTDGEQVVATLAPEMMALTTGRFATAQEIADAIAFLASPRSASTTGAELVVDSGMLKAL